MLRATEHTSKAVNINFVVTWNITASFITCRASSDDGLLIKCCRPNALNYDFRALPRCGAQRNLFRDRILIESTFARSDDQHLSTTRHLWKHCSTLFCVDCLFQAGESHCIDTNFGFFSCSTNFEEKNNSKSLRL